MQDAQLASLLTEPLKLLQQQQQQEELQQHAGAPLPLSVQLHVHVTSLSPSNVCVDPQSSPESSSAPTQALVVNGALVQEHTPHTCFPSLGTASQALSPTPFNASASQEWFSTPSDASATGLANHFNKHLATFPTAKCVVETGLPQLVSKFSTEGTFRGTAYSTVIEIPGLLKTAPLGLEFESIRPAAAARLDLLPSVSRDDSDSGGSSGPSNLSQTGTCTRSSASLDYQLSLNNSSSLTCALRGLRMSSILHDVEEGTMAGGGGVISIKASRCANMHADFATKQHHAEGGPRSGGGLTMEFHQGRPVYAHYTALLCQEGILARESTTKHAHVGSPASMLHATMGVFVCGPTGMRESAHKAFLALTPESRSHAKWYDQEFRS